MMFLIATAAAHVPHDAILAVAPPLTLTAAEPWYMTMSPHGTALFYESDSGGTTWDLLGGPHTGTELVGLARLADGSLAALTGPSVWVSADGRAWTNAVLPETAAAVQGVGNEVAFAGDTCLWTGPALGPYTCAVTGAVTALGPDAAVVDGHVVAFDGTTWNDVDAPASDLSAVLSTGDTTFAGTASGELFRYDGAWTACGAIPAGDARYPDIVRLAWTGDALLVATATVGPYRSEDACASFEDRGTGEPVLYGQEGGPGGVSEATVFLAEIGRAHV